MLALGTAVCILKLYFSAWDTCAKLSIKTNANKIERCLIIYPPKIKGCED
jgi:hypothetical protein